jgi:MFS family permease
MSKKQGGFYFGYWVVVTGFFLMGFLYAPAMTLVGLHVSPLAAEFGISTTASSFLITLSMFSAMIGAGFAGKMCTKYGTRRIVAIMLIVEVIGYAGLALSPSIFVSYVFSAIRGFGMVFVTLIPVSMMVTTWFGKRAVGKALGIASVGSGIGAMVLGPIVAGIIENMGWRSAYGLYVILAAACIPLVLACFSTTPASKGVARLGDDPVAAAATATSGDTSARGLTGGQALKSAMFWLAFLGTVAMCLAAQGWVNLAPTFYAGLKIDAMTIGTLIAVTALALSIAKIVLGAICDKFGTMAGVISCIACIVASYGGAIVAEIGVIAVLAFACSALIGLGQAGVAICLPLIAKDLSSQKDYGTILGYLTTGMYIGSSFGPLLLSMSLDRTGAFVAPFAIAIGSVVLALILYL